MKVLLLFGFFLSIVAALPQEIATWEITQEEISPENNAPITFTLLEPENDVNPDLLEPHTVRSLRGVTEQWMLCGTDHCKPCIHPYCPYTSNSGLNRDGDKEDLVECPSGFIHKGYRKYPQFWPAEDVYLRFCSNV